VEARGSPPILSKSHGQESWTPTCYNFLYEIKRTCGARRVVPERSSGEPSSDAIRERLLNRNVAVLARPLRLAAHEMRALLPADDAVRISVALAGLVAIG